MPSLRVMMAGFRFQIIVTLAEPAGFLLTVIIVPAFYAVVFLFIYRHTGRLNDLASYGILGAAILGIWSNTVISSGEIIDDERAAGTIELLVAAPSGSFQLAVLGRIGANATLSLLSLLATMLVGWAAFGATLQVTSPALFIQGLFVILLSTSAAGLILANAFVLSPSARLFQNTLTFPIYLLAGVAFPLMALPDWLRPLSTVVALAWGTDLLRSATGREAYYPPALSVAMGLGLCGTYLLIGHQLFMWTERRVRHAATLGSD